MEENKVKVRTQDRRVLKTKKLIREAFVALLVEKELEKITIKEIAERANVDRKTVYNYYSSIYEIHEELENELADSFEKSMENFHYTTFAPREIFEALSCFLEENLELFASVMRIQSESRLISRIIGYLQNTIQNRIGRKSERNPFKIQLVSEYITAGVFGVYRHWFNGDRKQPLKEFTQQVADLVVQSLGEYLSSV